MFPRGVATLVLALSMGSIASVRADDGLPPPALGPMEVPPGLVDTGKGLRPRGPTARISSRTIAAVTSPSRGITGAVPQPVAPGGPFYGGGGGGGFSGGG